MFPPSTLPLSGEAGRLLAIQQYTVRQALRDPVFTGFVDLAARLFQVPIALIALVGAHDVHYTATHGLAGPPWQPRPEAICSLVVERNQAVVLTDLRKSGPAGLRTAARAAARNNGYRFYAGIPLRTPAQAAIGTLCLVDRHQREFVAHERQLLEQLARLIERLLVVRQAYQTRRPAPEAWQLVQDYVTGKLRALASQAAQLGRPLSQPVPVSLVVAEPIMCGLNELVHVLAEPLPD